MNKIMFFAHLREAVGNEFITIDLAGKTVAEVKSLIAEQYNISNFDTVMTAVNEEFALDTDTIQAEDVVAFIPPVSGG